jgi:hypothetical protein
MEPGKIRLINTGNQNEAGITQVISLSPANRLYRITNHGPSEGAPGAMRLRITRSVLWGTSVSVFDLASGRSVDVFGSSITVQALETLQLSGSYDTL